MKISAIMLAAALTVVFGGNALADRNRCPANLTQNWMPIEKAVGKAEMLGYSVRQAKRSKGCWKIEGYDRNGAEIEILFDPASGDVVKSPGWRAPPGG